MKAETKFKCKVHGLQLLAIIQGGCAGAHMWGWMWVFTIPTALMVGWVIDDYITLKGCGYSQESNR